MPRTTVPPAHRSGPLVGTALLALLAALSFTPAVPRAFALGPTPTPAVDPTATADPSATAVPTPTPDPTPSVDPGPTPTVDPGPTPTPDPTPTPTPDPTPTPTPDPTPTPTPTATLPPGTIGAGGGVVSESNISLAVPEGALTGPTRFDIATATGPVYEDQSPIQAFAVVATDAESGSRLTAFGSAVSMSVSLADLDLTGIVRSNLRLAQLVAGAWSLLTTTMVDDTLVADIDAPGTMGVVEQPRTTDVTLTADSDAPSVGRRRIDPGAPLTLTIEAVPAGKLYRGDLVALIPAGWTIMDPAGGRYDATARRITWTVTNVAAGKAFVVSPVLIAPLDSPVDGSRVFTALFAINLVQPDGSAATAPDVTVLVAPRIAIEHVMLGVPGSAGGADTYQAQDASLDNATVFSAFRVRFRLENADSLSVTIRPQLEYRSLATPDAPFQPVPDPASFGEAAFHATSELPDFGTRFVPIASDGARMSGSPDRPVAFRTGYRSEGVNPGELVILAGGSATEIEFSVSPTVFADYLGTYEFRLSDAGGNAPLGTDVSSASAIPFSRTARITIQPQPQPDLSDGQRQGQPVSGVRYQLSSPAADGLLLAPGGAGPTTLPGPTSTGPLHGDMALTTDSCSACHRTHSAQGSALFALAGSQATVCFTCHNGTGAPTGPSHQYSLATANNPSTGSYYQHPATDPTAQHTGANTDEFQSVLNRHSLCTDCHNPHVAKDATQTSLGTASGWTASGAETGASGVAVTNGGAGSAPAYRFLVANQAQGSLPISLEYQLCFKCHSGWTQLPQQDAQHPSQWALDKGLEFNAANVSYHPIEAAGANTSPQMAASLSGNSPYKLWNFTTAETVRCSQCHADSSLLPALLAGTAGAGDRLDSHASANRGILLGNYRDRTLHLASDAYAALDFQLCYLCHAEVPFANASKDPQSDTRFPLHGRHVKYLAGKGTSTITDIDAAEAGAGDAICAECHFRIHSSVTKVGAQDVYRGLVNFAPDVTDLSATSWTTATGLSGEVTGSCALTCHGYTHTSGNSSYVAVAAPAP